MPSLLNQRVKNSFPRVFCVPYTSVKQQCFLCKTNEHSQPGTFWSYMSLMHVCFCVSQRQVDSYILPSQRGASGDQGGPGYKINNVLLNTSLDVVDDDGNVIGQRDGVIFQF